MRAHVHHRPDRRSLLRGGIMLLATLAGGDAFARDDRFTVTEEADRIRLAGAAVEATINKRGYVSGVAGGSFLDKATGFRDAGFGLDIVDWVMEPGSDEAYRDQLPGDLVYEFGDKVHGRRPKRSIEGPQICTRAGRVSPRVIRGQ